MKQLIRISSLSLIVFIISLFIAIPVLAFPSLPSSFYGTVKVNAANVPDGTVIEALIGGQVYAEGFTQTYQGGVWHTGTNVNLNLTVSSSEAIATPQATPTPVPTQTAIVQNQPSPTPTANVQALSTPTILVQPSQAATQPAQPSQIATKPSQPSPIPSLDVQSSLTPVASENDQDNGSGNSAPVMLSVIGLVVVLIAGYMFLAFRKK
jgi:hypothetical protein